MAISISELKNIKPFDTLSDDTLTQIASLFTLKNYKQDLLYFVQEQTKIEGIEILQNGVIETFFYDHYNNKKSVYFLQKGDIYGGISILYNQHFSMRNAIVSKNTTTLFLPISHFLTLIKDNLAFRKFFVDDFGERMLQSDFSHFYKQLDDQTDVFSVTDRVFTQKIESVNYRKIIQVALNTSVQNAVHKMNSGRVSCLYVENEKGDIVGYVTDIMLRDKVLGLNLDAEHTTVGEIMELPHTSNVDEYVFEAVLKMQRMHVRYLLVEKNNKYIGFLSRNRLLAEQSQTPISFITSVKLARDNAELSSKWKESYAHVKDLLDRGINASIANQVITAVSDIILEQIIRNVKSEMGEPPAKFCFMVLGSEGRQEQTFKTDQDNAIIYEDKANEHREEVRLYFLEFAKRISDSLNEVGFAYCTGGYMAMNPKWTHSLSHWKNNYREWMSNSVPENVIKFSTFFDCRFIYGEESIMQNLYDFLHEELQKPLERLFHFMAQNALQYEPPLTFFKGIKTFVNEGKNVINVKRAMSPIVDLVRVYSLKNGLHSVNTGKRLEELEKKGVFSAADTAELLQAYYFLMGLRLRHQAIQVLDNQEAPDNYIVLDTLSGLQKQTLTEAFKIIKRFQTKIKMDFTNSMN